MGPVGRLTANPTQVYQLFANLIDNAVTHNDSEEPEVTIRLLSGEGGAHRYLVSDNGLGIPPDIIDEVFLPFVKGATGGSGIGLATVEKIVKIYGGEIKAYNDGGACFEFVIRDAEAKRA